MREHSMSEHMGASATADTVLADAPESWPVESTTEVFRNWLISVRNDEVRMPGARLAERTVVTHPGAVSVLALGLGASRRLMRGIRSDPRELEAVVDHTHRHPQRAPAGALEVLELAAVERPQEGREPDEAE